MQWGEFRFHVGSLGVGHSLTWGNQTGRFLGCTSIQDHPLQCFCCQEQTEVSGLLLLWVPIGTLWREVTQSKVWKRELLLQGSESPCQYIQQDWVNYLSTWLIMLVICSQCRWVWQRNKCHGCWLQISLFQLLCCLAKWIWLSLGGKSFADSLSTFGLPMAVGWWWVERQLPWFLQSCLGGSSWLRIYLILVQHWLERSLLVMIAGSAINGIGRCTVIHRLVPCIRVLFCMSRSCYQRKIMVCAKNWCTTDARRSPATKFLRWRWQHWLPFWSTLKPLQVKQSANNHPHTKLWLRMLVSCGLLIPLMQILGRW